MPSQGVIPLCWSVSVWPCARHYCAVSVLQVGPRENPYYQEILEHLYKIQREGKVLSHLVLVSEVTAQLRNLLHGRKRLQQAFAICVRVGEHCMACTEKSSLSCLLLAHALPFLQIKPTALPPAHQQQQCGPWHMQCQAARDLHGRPVYCPPRCCPVSHLWCFVFFFSARQGSLGAWI